MKRSTSTRISHLCRALLMAGVLANLCLAQPFASGSVAAQQQEEFISNFANSSQSHALTNAPRAHSHVPASKQKRVRHPALDFAALPPECFHLLAAALGHRTLDRNQRIFHSTFLVRPRGRAPPVSI